MAESQELIAYDPALQGELTTCLSQSRLQPYLAAVGGQFDSAMKLYLWNARLSKAFLFPLHVAEVVIRNAMHDAISAVFGGPGWILRPTFALTPESKASLDRAIDRLGPKPSSDQVVASLTFDFWSNLFRREYESLWSTPGVLAQTFPNLGNAKGRAEVQRLVAHINKFRNRVAHHEPIYKGFNHRRMLEGILELIGMRSFDVMGWVRKNSTVMAVVRTPPNTFSNLSGLPLVSANIRPPHVIPGTTSLKNALRILASARPAILLTSVTGRGYGTAISAQMILNYIERSSETCSGMIDLNEHTIDQAIAAEPPIRLAEISPSASTGDLSALFYPSNTPQAQRPQAVVLVDEQNKPVGLVQKPDIKF